MYRVVGDERKAYWSTPFLFGLKTGGRELSRSILIDLHVPFAQVDESIDAAGGVTVVVVEVVAFSLDDDEGRAAFL